VSRFVLVHGAWHGGWCWHKVIPYLEGAGHSVIAPDLPLSESLDTYVETARAAIEQHDDPVILVGHSMAGAVVSAVAEQVPDRIKRLVFLTAFAPQDGESINDLARTNLATALRDNLVPSADGNSVSVEASVIPQAFYHDCDEKDVAFATERLRPQNPAAFVTPLTLTEENYGGVDKQYIECIEDQVIHIHLQRTMARRAGCTLINSLQTSHSPFFSAPAALAAHLATVGIKDARQ